MPVPYNLVRHLLTAKPVSILVANLCVLGRSAPKQRKFQIYTQPTMCGMLLTAFWSLGLRNVSACGEQLEIRN